MKKGDFILIIITLLFFAMLFLPKVGGNIVKVSVNGELYKEASLDENCEIKVKSEFGENTVVIKDGEVFVKNADCPDKLCEKAKLGKAKSIVCLPNRLTVTLENKKTEEEIDVVI